MQGTEGMKATRVARRLVVVTAALALAAAAAAGQAQAKVVWLCKPGMRHNPCQPSLRTTVFASFGQQGAVSTPKVPRNPRVDCFYVYPTVSNQQRPVATKAKDPEIRDIALFQAARYSQVCRVFAPVYRQITVPGLNSGHLTAKDQAVGAKDVLEAWKQYLAKYNKGRGVVLLGHSQGSLRLTQLIRQQIDKKPAVRRRLVSAILLGGNITVANGSDRGGSFSNIPACKTSTQFGCVVAYSTFDETPPDHTIFGRTTAAGEHVLCTNPAALGGGPALLDSILPAKRFAPGFIAAGIQLLDFPLPKVSTPWIESTGAFSGECVTENDATVLKVTPQAGAPVPKASPTPEWGLHLIDANVAQGDLVKLVRAQTAAYLG